DVSAGPGVPRCRAEHDRRELPRHRVLGDDRRPRSDAGDLGPRRRHTGGFGRSAKGCRSAGITMPLPPEFHELAKKVNNWGRWGPEDERGTLNLITDEVVARAAAGVRSGRRFSLALPLSEQGPMMGNVPGRPSNPNRTMLSLHLAMSKDPDAIRFSDDQVSMPLQAATHWDSLAHVSYMGKIYNGFPEGSVDENGAARCGIDKVGALVSRGVLLDVARARCVSR